MTTEMNPVEQVEVQGELLVAIYTPDVRHTEMPVFKYIPEKKEFAYECLDAFDLETISLTYDVESVLEDEDWLVFLVTGDLMRRNDCEQRALSKEEAKVWLRKEFVKHATR